MPDGAGAARERRYHRFRDPECRIVARRENPLSIARALLRGVVGAGSAAFGALALLRSPGVARWCGTDEATIRALGVRDLGVGLAVAAFPRSRLPILARVAFDTADALVFGRRRPRVAAAAAGSALVGVAALRAR